MFVSAEANQDVVQLLLVIRGYCCRFDNHQQSTWALEQAKQQVSMYYQAHDVTNTECVEHFKELVGVVETYRGAYGRKPGLVSTELEAQGVRPKTLSPLTMRKSAMSNQMVLGLENHTFDIGNVEYASKYKKTVSAIANHIQRGY